MSTYHATDITVALNDHNAPILQDKSVPIDTSNHYLIYQFTQGLHDILTEASKIDAFGYSKNPVNLYYYQLDFSNDEQVQTMQTIVNTFSDKSKSIISDFLDFRAFDLNKTINDLISFQDEDSRFFGDEIDTLSDELIEISRLIDGLDFSSLSSNDYQQIAPLDLKPTAGGLFSALDKVLIAGQRLNQELPKYKQEVKTMIDNYFNNI